MKHCHRSTDWVGRLVKLVRKVHQVAQHVVHQVAQQVVHQVAQQVVVQTTYLPVKLLQTAYFVVSVGGSVCLLSRYVCYLPPLFIMPYVNFPHHTAHAAHRTHTSHSTEIEHTSHASHIQHAHSTRLRCGGRILNVTLLRPLLQHPTAARSLWRNAGTPSASHAC